MERIYPAGIQAPAQTPAMRCACGKGELYPYANPINGQDWNLASWNEPGSYVQHGNIRLRLRCSSCHAEFVGEFEFRGICGK